MLRVAGLFLSVAPPVVEGLHLDAKVINEVNLWLEGRRLGGGGCGTKEAKTKGTSEVLKSMEYFIPALLRLIFCGCVCVRACLCVGMC